MSEELLRRGEEVAGTEAKGTWEVGRSNMISGRIGVAFLL